MIKLISIHVELESGESINIEAQPWDIAPCMNKIIQAYDKNMERQGQLLELVIGKQKFDEGE